MHVYVITDVSTKDYYTCVIVQVRLEIGQYAAEHGIPEALQHFKAKFGRPLSDSTVRSLRRVYMETLSKNKDSGNKSDIKELPKKERGRPLKLREHDQDVLDYIENIRSNGGMVSVQLVMDAARGVLLHKAKHKLKEFGGNLQITKGWADSFIRRMKQGGYLPDTKICSISKEKVLAKKFQHFSGDGHKCTKNVASISRSSDILQPHTAISCNNNDINSSSLVRPPLDNFDLTRYPQQNPDTPNQHPLLQNINPPSNPTHTHLDLPNMSHTNPENMIHHEQTYIPESMQRDLSPVATNYIAATSGFPQQLRGSGLDLSASPAGYPGINELQQRTLDQRTIEQQPGSNYVESLVHNRLGVLQGRNIVHSNIDHTGTEGNTIYPSADTARFNHHSSMYGTP